MKKGNRPSLPAGWKRTTCPDCGGELKFGELIFSSRSVRGWDAHGVLHIAEDYEDSLEPGEDEHLYCTGCIRQWSLPREVSFDNVDAEIVDESES